MNSADIPIDISPPIESPGSKLTPKPPSTHLPPEGAIEGEGENINLKPQSISKLLSDIINSQEVTQAIVEGEAPENICPGLSVSPTIVQTEETLRTINSIKDELCRLPFDKCENQYIANSVYPLVNILYQLSTTSLNLANSANLLSISSVVHPKHSKLKDTVDLVYDINEECEDIYEIVRKRLRPILHDSD